MLFYLISEHLFTWKKTSPAKQIKRAKKKKKGNLTSTHFIHTSPEDTKFSSPLVRKAGWVLFFASRSASAAPYLWRARLCRPRAAAPCCPGMRRRRGTCRKKPLAPRQPPAWPRTAAPVRRAGASRPARLLSPPGSSWPRRARSPQKARWRPRRTIRRGCQREHPSAGARSRRTHPSTGRVKAGIAKCSLGYIGAGGGAEKGDSV